MLDTGFCNKAASSGRSLAVSLMMQNSTGFIIAHVLL